MKKKSLIAHPAINSLIEVLVKSQEGFAPKVGEK
jgi:hypothetical protein